MTMMRPFWAPNAQQAVAIPDLVPYGTPVKWSNTASLTAANVFAGGLCYIWCINRGGTTLPTTPSGWTRVFSSTLQSIGVCLFIKTTPTSTAQSASLGSNYDGVMGSLKLADDAPISVLSVERQTGGNAKGVTTQTLNLDKQAVVDRVYGLAFSYIFNDDFTGALGNLSDGAVSTQLFYQTPSDDSYLGVLCQPAAGIAGTGQFSSTISGLNSGNAFSHLLMALRAEPAVAGGLTPVYRNAQFSSTQQNAGVAYSWASNALGAASADRYVVVCVGTAAVAGDNVAPTVAGVTVDGVALAKLADIGITPGSAGLATEIWGGYVDTANTTGTISVTFGTTATRGCAIAYYTITGSESISVVDTDAFQYNNAGANFGAHDMISQRDVWIGFGNHFGNTAAFTWTGATEQGELNYASAARTSSAVMQGNGSLTPAFTSGSAGDGAACGVQLRGA